MGDSTISTCWRCGEGLPGEPIYLDAECTEPTTYNNIRFDSSGVYVAAYVECPGCGDVIGGEIKLDGYQYIDYTKDDPHEEHEPAELRWTVYNDGQEATVTAVFAP